jgi:hypothetical protein
MGRVYVAFSTFSTWIGFLIILGEVVVAIAAYQLFGVWLARYKSSWLKWSMVWIAYLIVMGLLGWVFLTASSLIHFGRRG